MEQLKIIDDSFCYGIGAGKLICRKWYNPMRYIRGELYIKQIDIRKMYRKPSLVRRIIKLVERKR